MTLQNEVGDGVGVEMLAHGDTGLTAADHDDFYLFDCHRQNPSRNLSLQIVANTYSEHLKRDDCRPTAADRGKEPATLIGPGPPQIPVAYMIHHSFGQFDNHASSYSFIEVKPLAAAIGAEICGVDCAHVTDSQFAEIEHALFRHKMIFFRGQQHVTHADQAVFSRRFGPFAQDAYTNGVPGFPEVQPVIKEADERTGMLFGSGWHTDSPFLATPPAVSLLRAVEVPPFGGDTMWANSALAYVSLSDTMRQIIDTLRVHMSMANVIAEAQRFAAPTDSPLGRLGQVRGELPGDLQVKVDGNYHPLVRTHPVTGEKALYCDATYPVGIEGLRPEEAQPILRFLVDHITQPAFTCRLRWEAGTFAMWDNRLCLHQAFNDYDGFRREMYRSTIEGERPK